MAAVADPQVSGPSQQGRGVHGQYVYAIVMVQPTPEVIARFLPTVHILSQRHDKHPASTRPNSRKVYYLYQKTRLFTRVLVRVLAALLKEKSLFF